MKRLLSILGMSLLLLAGCRTQVNTIPDNEAMEESSSSEAAEPLVTKDVTYRGVLEKAGISVYMEGSHRLTLTDGRVLMLQSSSMDLDTYLEKDVLVTGDIRPTTEAGGIIMEVKDVALADGGDVSSVMESSSAESEAMSSAEVSSAAPSSVAVSSAAPVVSSSKASSVPASSSSAAAVQASSQAGDSAAMDAKTSAMAKGGTDTANWTRPYCTSHIGFCINIHKNWWYKSFGTTTNYLWHVEIGPEELFNLGDGPLVVNLVSGSLESLGISDSEVRAQGEYAVGYRAWTDNRHFEITGPTSLRGAVQNIVDNLAVSEVTP